MKFNPSRQLARWNFRKANWEKFSSYIEHTIDFIPQKAEHLPRFINLTKKSAAKHISRGYRKSYLPGWSEVSEERYEKYKTPTQQNDKALLKSLDDSRRQRWIETVENLDMKHSSRKAWALLKRLEGNSKPKETDNKVSAQSIASVLLENSKGDVNKTHKRRVKKELYNFKRQASPLPSITLPFQAVEIVEAIKELKKGKAAGKDGIYPEFLHHLGPKAIVWVANVLFQIFCSGKPPKTWKESIVVAVLKPGKPADSPKSYRPISLLNVMSKLMDRVILKRISPIIEKAIPSYQAGFRRSRDCCEQVAALTSHIEKCFNERQKAGAAFIDLITAYDTVWKHGLLNKLAKIIPCKWTIKYIDDVSSNRRFHVIMGNQKSKPKTLNNGLPQGSVLAPVLFNVYISDLPETISRKFA